MNWVKNFLKSTPSFDCSNASEVQKLVDEVYEYRSQDSIEIPDLIFTERERSSNEVEGFLHTVVVVSLEYRGESYDFNFKVETNPMSPNLCTFKVMCKKNDVELFNVNYLFATILEGFLPRIGENSDQVKKYDVVYDDLLSEIALTSKNKEGN